MSSVVIFVTVLTAALSNHLFSDLQLDDPCEFELPLAALDCMRGWARFQMAASSSAKSALDVRDCAGSPESKGSDMMDDVMNQAVVMAWARRNLPGRLGVLETAKLLGFAEHDIPILMATKKLTPLGDPAPNAPKWFASIEIVKFAADKEWLSKAAKEVSKHWRYKRASRTTPPVFPRKESRVESSSPEAS